MISSLANFFMLVLYHGSYPARVSWTLLMFTMGVVAIARVAIEKDRAYSMGYAGVLGLVTFVSMLRFVDSPIFSAVILVVIAVLADRIVRDCTLIDDDVDASGQGLIDSGRLFVRKQIKPTEPPDESSADSITDQPPQNSGASRRTNAHQPGRTVMYLALAALPLFGLGQFFLRSDPETWARAQKLLAFYLFASLSLLVTTSFLGLRRYLRQRKVEMPADVTVAWLAGGVAMIALILFIAFMAPVPGRLIASIELPEFLDSPDDTVASKSGWGDEAADKTSENAASTSGDPDAAEKEVQDIAAGKDAPAGDVGTGQRKDGPAGDQKGKSPDASGPSDAKSSESKDAPSGKQESNSSDSKQESKGDSGDAKSSPSESQQNDSQPSQDAKSESGESPANEDQAASNESDAKQDRSPQADKNDANDAGSTKQGSSSAAKSNPLRSVANAMPGISSLLKFIIFLALVAIVVAFVWMHRHAIGLWWANWFQPKADDGQPSFDEFLAQENSVPLRSFASFSNPIGREQDPRRVIVITFAAWEAYCREQGIQRSREETPNEFLRRATASQGDASTGLLSAHAVRLVEAYNRILYGRGKATDRDVAAASELWRSMTG
ncbi:DUF4129 domain-containing protein [Rubripirellula lacrimiformis]|nr:DUF4129 domain-containing protein [Rubripirellula lacrimiformis]